MVSLIAENVSLRFPIYSQAQVYEHAAGDAHDARLISGASGRIIAVQALKEVSLALGEGDRLALLGRNGSGKTTLLQVLTGILPPGGGRVRSLGRATSIININLGMQFEASGHRNITLRGLAAGYSRARIEEKRSEIVAFCELGEFLDMPLTTYSSGMLMRLSFSIATAFDPQILLLDEWLSTGDEAFRAKATKRMQEFVNKAGILVLASHNRQLLLDNCNKALWLEKGEVKAFGEVTELLGEYERRAA